MIPTYNLQLNDPANAMAVFIACNAEFDMAGDVNHWVPAFSLSELGEEGFRKVSQDADSLAAREMHDLENQLEELSSVYAAMDDASEHEMQIVEAKMVSLELSLKAEQAWDAFRWRCKKAELYPVRVPADGDCMLWSWYCLSEDLVLASPLLASDDAKEKITRFRDLLSKGWKKVQRDAVWQEIFDAFYMPYDVEGGHENGKASGVKKEESVKMEAPTTPPKKKARDLGCVDLLTPTNQDKNPVPEPLKRVKNCNTAPGWTVANNAGPLKFQTIGSSQKERDSNSTQVKKEPVKEPSNTESKCMESSQPARDSKSRQVKKEPANQPSNTESKAAAFAPRIVNDDNSDGEFEVPELLEQKGEEKEEKERKRSCMRKQKTQNQLRLVGLNGYLATLGLGYLDWQAGHWQQLAFETSLNHLYS